MRTRETDVLVVGAGPVGLTAALALAERGTAVTVVDEEARGSLHSYALALHPSSLDLLVRLGVGERLLAAGRRVDAVQLVVEGEPQGRVELGSAGGDHPFALALPQSVLEDELRQALAARDVRVQFDHRVAALREQDDHVEVTVDRMERVSGGYAVSSTTSAVGERGQLRAGAVIGADGHHSMVRRVLALEVESAAPARLFAAFELLGEAEGVGGDEAVLAFDGATDNGVWPLPDGRWRFSFELDDPELVAGRGERRAVVQIGGRAYPAVAERRMEALRADRLPGITVRVDEVTWSVAVRFESRLTAPLGRGRVWLAGDAGHLAPPLGMQSMNRGLAEAVELADALAGGRADAAALAAYDRDARRGWRALLGLEAGYSAAAGAAPWVAAHVHRIAQGLPASGEQLDALLAGVGIARA